MKYMYIALALLLAVSVRTAEAVEISNPTTFDVSVTGITKVASPGRGSVFSFKPVNIKNEQNIAYWKVRTYCDMSVEATVSGSKGDNCGTAVDIPYSATNTFAILFKNKSNQMKSFAFKLKAYDKNGVWLHTAEKNFRWK